LATLI